MEHKKVKVAIVGAGFAGIGAAYRLLKETNFSVKVLEAGSKPGGRIETVSFRGGETKAELGATYFYQYDQHRDLRNCVKEIGLLGELRKEFDEALVTSRGFLSNGAEVPRPVVEHYKDVFYEVQDEAAECSRRNDWSYVVDKDWEKSKVISPKHLSLERYLTDRFNVAVKHSKMPCPLPDFEPKHVLQRMLTNEEIMNGTKRSEGVDLVAYGDYVDPTGQYALPDGGYGDIVDEMLRFYQIPVCLNTEVEEIDWNCFGTTLSKDESETAPVIVKCRDGSSYEADHVIVTVSIGVLQQRCLSITRQLFNPPLPSEKLAAINTIGMGIGGILLFKFPEPILDTPHEVIELFWLNCDLHSPMAYPWIRGLDVLVHIKDTNIYGASLTGEGSKQAERSTEQEIGEAISLVLEKFLKKSVKRPISVKRSSWNHNPNILGIYSYSKTGESGQLDRRNLAAPVSGSTPLQILFAGEATHEVAFGTTVGAFETGIREAEKLIQHYGALDSSTD